MPYTVPDLCMVMFYISLKKKSLFDFLFQRSWLVQAYILHGISNYDITAEN